MNYLEILQEDILEVLEKEVLGTGNEERHNAMYIYVSERIIELRDNVLGEYRSGNKLIHQKDKKASFDNFIDGFVSSEWKKYFNSKSNSPAELRKLVKNCLVESSATKNLLDGKSIALKSKDFYSVYLFYSGWNDFARKKSKNRNHKNKGNRLPKELILRLPKLNKNQIVGRESDIEDLRERLFNNDNKQIVLMNGMGGIGKTTVASVYVSENYPYYKHIVWVSQLTNDFMNDFVNTRGLQEVLKIDNSGKKLLELFDEMIMKLKGIIDIPCLMIIDNAKEELYKYHDLLPSKPNWHVLITSREVIPHFDIKELGFLSEDEAIELFTKLYEKDDFDRVTIEKIVEYVDCHTLTIEILALTTKKQGLSLKMILSALEENIEAGVIIRHSEDKIKKITSYLCFIFKNISELSNDEKWLLTQFTCLPSEFHSVELLRELIQPNEYRKSIFKRLLSDLSDKGWILYNKSNDSYKIHRIIIDVVSRSLSLNFEIVKPLVTTISSKLSFQEGEKDNPADKFQWIPFGNILIRKLEMESTFLILKLQNNLATVIKELQGEKNLLQAKSLLEKAIISYENNFGKGHPFNESLYSNLANVFKDLGGKKNLLHAKSLLEKAVVSNENNYRKGHSINEVFYSNLANVLTNLGGKENLLQAKSLIVKAIASEENKFGKEHFKTIISYSILAKILQSLGGKENLLQAKSLMVKTIILNEKVFGKGHPTTANGYSILARVYDELGGAENLKKAITLYEKAIIIDEINFGNEHPNIAIDYSNLADIFKDLGGEKNLLHAKSLYEKAMVIDENNFRNEHPNIAIRYSNLALVLHHLMGEENLLQAKSLFKKAMVIDENNFGNEHPITAVRYSNLATVLRTLGGEENLHQAKSLLEKTIVIEESELGNDNSKTASSYSNLASVLQSLGGEENLLEAKSLFEKAMIITENRLGREHPSTLRCYSNLAVLLIDLRGKENLLQARILLEKAMVIAEGNFKKEHPTTAVIYVNLATVYRDLGGKENFLRAKLLFQKAMKIFKETLGINHPNIKTVRSHLEKIEKLLNH